MRTQDIADHYAICALWSSTDGDDVPLDRTYCVGDINEKTLNRMRGDVEEFIDANADALRESKLTDEQIGHDLWLTRNGHGSGFWDRGLGELGKTLSAAAQRMGSANLYVGDDGQIYQY